MSTNPVAFLPGVRGHDSAAQHWLGQVTLRLRREVCWLWRERSAQGADEQGGLPGAVDRTLAALDLLRYERDKRAFFAADVTARHLSERIAAAGPPPPVQAAARGSFGWVVRELRLQPVESFVLALALLPVVDAAAGAVIASCQNDAARTAPSLALAQRLWDAPDELLACFDPAHVLFGCGLLAPSQPGAPVDWNSPLAVPPLVARELLGVAEGWSSALRPVAPDDSAQRLGAAALARVGEALRPSTAQAVVPLIGAPGAALARAAAAAAAEAGVVVVEPAPALARDHLPAAMTVAWLRGAALCVPASRLADPMAHDAARIDALPLPSLPLGVFVTLDDRSQLRALRGALSPITVPPIGHADRLELWRAELPGRAALWPELARRLRCEAPEIARIATGLRALGAQASDADLLAAARTDPDLGSLAQGVVPRFSRGELMLPPQPAALIDEIVAAMNNLTRVHYEWGTARPWNEGGLAVLFAGPPGTGKTMAAEAIAAELQLPLYRIDLSQVVNKYIGETEKNLARLFDAADGSEVVLFFDEADALFGKRTEVKDAHDRYANLEVSYLLERMERFKGLAILATNRRKDLDEAFMRRLRFVVEFPLPGVEERARIWRAVIPPGVDASELDIDFLARRFALAGGHIRAIVFHACLQSAAEGAPRKLGMPAVVRAVQREYDKLERANSLDQFGPYAPLVAAQRSAK